MQTWKWLYNPQTPFNWRFVRNVVIKAMVLFVTFNVLFALLDPLPALGKLSGYNGLFTGRERLPYGENPQVAYNLSLYQIDAMFASHTLADTEDDEFRVVLLGDSSIWGILLEPEDTLAGQINAAAYHTAEGQHISVYNLGYPTMSLIKDLLLLDYAMAYDPDLIVWAFTLESFDQAGQLDTALVQNNTDRVQDLIATYDLHQNPDDARFVETNSLWDRTIIARRRTLADLLRLQYYGVAWSVTGIDQEYREAYTPRAVDLQADETWHGFRPRTFTEDDLAFDVLRAGVALAGETPVLFINEPMLLSDGANSNLRYNAFYPRWAYDDFRRALHEKSGHEGWQLLDLWDVLPDATCYTDSAVHLTPACSAQFAEQVGPMLVQVSNPGSFTIAE
ncbi:MAG: hypothetical protein K8S97_06230 [Anaerolineae bacterium]|nr:hypothetical protein [Anaerolineae bacterium]